MRNFQAISSHQHKHIGRFLNLHKCSFKGLMKISEYAKLKQRWFYCGCFQFFRLFRGHQKVRHDYRKYL